MDEGQGDRRLPAVAVLGARSDDPPAAVGSVAFAKDFRRSLEFQRRREWVHRETEMLAGAKLLVVGAGPIGKEISRQARCFGMQTSAVARTERSDDAYFGRVFSSEQLDEALPDADYVVVVAPLTDQTRGMFGAAQFG